MKRELKSIAHASIANGIHIYVPEGEKNYIIGSRLVCAECNEPWYMNFTECFICGAMNPFLYRCDSCKSFNSITKSAGGCNNCGKRDTLHQECPNPKCLSNTNTKVHKAINMMGGVFNKQSGFRISLQHCLNCGSKYHMYKVRKLSVFTTSSTKMDITNLRVDDQEVLSTYSFVIFRITEKDKIKYSFLSLSEYLQKKNNFQLSHIYHDYGKMLKEIFLEK